MTDRTYVFEKVEKTVMDAVKTVLKAMPQDIDRGILYSVKGNVPLYVNMMRSICLYVSRNMYGLSYPTIARHTGMRIRSVMKSIRKTRHLIFADDTYFAIFQTVRNRLETGRL